MTREFLKKQVSILRSTYERFTITQEQFDIWYKCFADCDEKIFEQAVMNYIKNSEYPPVIAGVMKYYREIVDYKQDMQQFFHRQYMTLISVWEEEFNADTLIEFINLVCKYPKEQRKDKAVEITHQAVSFHHDCEYEGRKAPTLMEYIRGIR